MLYKSTVLRRRQKSKVEDACALLYTLRLYNYILDSEAKRSRLMAQKAYYSTLCGHAKISELKKIQCGFVLPKQTQTAKTQSTHEAEKNILRLRVGLVSIYLYRVTYQAVGSFIVHLRNRQQTIIWRLILWLKLFPCVFLVEYHSYQDFYR